MHERDYDAYDLDDPKHPDFSDMAADRADMERKRLKEDGPEWELSDLIGLGAPDPSDSDDPALD